MIKNIKEIADPARIHYARPKKADFFNVVRKRVDAYFRDNNLSKKAGAEFWTKAIFILAAYFGAWFAIVLGEPGFLALMGLYLVFHVLETEIIFNIGHDAGHHAISNKKWVNDLLCNVFNIVGSSDYFWKLKHNVSHHYNTNIPEYDADIELMGFLRFSPFQPLQKMHRNQHVYAWFMYPMLGFFVVFVREYRFMGLKDLGNLKNMRHSGKEKFRFYFSKFFNLMFALVVPMLLIPGPWWTVLVASFVGRLFAGTLLAFVLAPAHLVEDSVFPEADEKGNVEYTFAEHQVVVSTDFDVESKLSNILYGGLNAHVIHHLFPAICHTHYIPLTRIVKQTAEEFGLKYNHMTHFNALKSHHGFLKKFGKEAWEAQNNQGGTPNPGGESPNTSSEEAPELAKAS